MGGVGLGGGERQWWALTVVPLYILRVVKEEIIRVPVAANASILTIFLQFL